MTAGRPARKKGKLANTRVQAISATYGQGATSVRWGTRNQELMEEDGT